MGDVDVVDLLVAVERLVELHRDELDVLNVFPVPDADTGRNVLATVRAARVGAEQAAVGQRRRAAVRGALEGARGNAGVLTSQLLRGLVEQAEGDAATWPARLARADELARAAVAHPVEGSLLTAVRAAAAAAAEHDVPGAQLSAATAAAHAAVRDSPTLLEVLARAGVVDAGARAAALVLEAVTAHLGGTVPAPPVVVIPEGGPRVADCDAGEEPFEVMYLLDPAGEDVTDAVRRGLDRLGGSVVVVEADRLVSVHVHTDDIGGALDVGLAHGRPHHVRVEDLHEGQRAAVVRDGGSTAVGRVPRRRGLVVGASGVGIARLAADVGATTVPLATPPDVDQLREAVLRTGASHVVVLPGDPRLAAMAGALVVDGVAIDVVAAADGPARVLASLAVLEPGAPDVDLLGEVAAAVRSGAVDDRGEEGWVATGLGEEVAVPTLLEALAALLQLLGHDDAGGGAPAPELVSVLLGDQLGVAQRDAVVAVVERHWPRAEVEVVDAQLTTAALVVGAE